MDLQSGNVCDYTPFQGVRALTVKLNPDFPDGAMVLLNVRDRSLFDVYLLNLKNGAMELDTENPGDVHNWHTDPKFRVRAAEVLTPDGGTEIRVRDDDKGWKSLLKVGPDEILETIDFTADGRSLFLKSSIGRDTAAVVEKNIDTGVEKIIAASDEVDAGEVIINPHTRVVEAVSFAPGRTVWRVIDPGVKADFEGLARLNDGDFRLVNRTAANDAWLVLFHSDRQPPRFYKWDRKAKEGFFLFSTRPRLEGLPLAEMQAIVIAARDGLKMHSYLTLPNGVPARKLPMVLFPHDGPWLRDTWGFIYPYAQWLANRGYAVLQPNYRGSTGYGKKLLNAGNKEFGRKMHDDLIDCVNWAVKEGIADPHRIGIFGGSYGGYCALAGVTFTPKVFACAVDVVGPSNLKTLLAFIPSYWKSARGMLDTRVGNIDDPRDADLLHHASPLNFADRIVRPLLIGHGANDPRVKQAESEQIVAAIEKNGGSVTYVLYPDEGHGFARPENGTDFNARAEQFLAEHLGGCFEPMPADKIPGSSALVRVIKGRH
ncbi:alpha/beta hydrolase family protein [Pedosphaera parvula]|uniref:Peptidase S9 prolyl oligopeptidase active site domain protein n=1 Tax=Pedosphaera parvula (strain Ellin514) TaxID=320771 RepID=B9XNT8_PEDPL|nr:S9 family peptidase [Pedosphaera parvula]EEF58511.1 peptidase S9 prolyl oligopeptidase active site domain protein [Pedosphaera parvula Ellin514]